MFRLKKKDTQSGRTGSVSLHLPPFSISLFVSAISFILAVDGLSTLCVKATEESVCVCVCCGDKNQFTQSHCGDYPPIWGQSLSPQCKPLHFRGKTWFLVRVYMKGLYCSVLLSGKNKCVCVCFVQVCPTLSTVGPICIILFILVKVKEKEIKNLK